MNAPADCPEPRRLGTYLQDLRPGDACPCCGAALEEAAPAAPRRGSVGTALGIRRPGQTEGARELVCPECGCELAEVANPFAGEGVLSPAA
jgi:hypothetical protein